jgi:hypothetical protein
VVSAADPLRSLISVFDRRVHADTHNILFSNPEAFLCCPWLSVCRPLVMDDKSPNIHYNQGSGPDRMLQLSSLTPDFKLYAAIPYMRTPSV